VVTAGKNRPMGRSKTRRGGVGINIRFNLKDTDEGRYKGGGNRKKKSGKGEESVWGGARKNRGRVRMRVKKGSSGA